VRPLARYCRFVKREDLDSWESKGWRAISHYAVRSDDIESVMIGWFEDTAPEVVDEQKAKSPVADIL
jgi:hypothetical protein